ncbi:hypothetical protein MG295_00253 [Bacillus phage vB_BcgM]|nr:hypothetical protein MG295_00253 [Bacillus phage vB_BcgM]
MKISDDVRYLQKELHDIIDKIHKETTKPFYLQDKYLIDCLYVQKWGIEDLIKDLLKSC